MCCSRSARALLLATTLVIALVSNASAKKPTERYSSDRILSNQPSNTASRAAQTVVNSPHDQLAPSTSKPAYALNEPVELTVTNIGFDVVEFTNPCTFEWIFWVYNGQGQLVYDGPPFCPFIYDPVFIYPFQSRSFTWQQQEPPGIYRFGVDGQPPYAEFVVLPDQPSSISEAKQLGDGSFVVLGPEIVTYASPSAFYLESVSRACGLRVDKVASGLAAGMKATVSGTMRTNASGERYIEPWEILQDGTGTLDPIGITNRALGGWGWRYDPDTHAGQQGVIGGAGLNNIGLLVRTWGKVTQIGPDYLYVDDGSNLRDGTSTGTEENTGVRVICDPTGRSSEERVQVTGISSCFDDRRRALLACDVSLLGATVCGTVADIDRNVIIDADVWIDENSHTRSLATGAYRLRGAPSGWQTIRASAVVGGQMWAGSAAVEVLKDQPTMNANIVLAPASNLTAITGYVFDDTGHRVSGARVLLTTRLLLPSQSSAYDGPYGSLVAITDDRGFYRLGDVPIGLNAVIAASKVGFDNDEVAIEGISDDMTVDFELGPSTVQTPNAPYLDSIEAYTMPSPLAMTTSMSLGAKVGGVDPYDAIRAFTSPRFRESLKTRKATAAMAAPRSSMSAGPLIEIDLYWDALADNLSRTLAGYGIYRRHDLSDPSLAIDFVRDPYANFYGDMGGEIEPNVGYRYRVSAVNVEFLDRWNEPVPEAESNWSNELGVTPLGLLHADLPANGANVSGNPLFTWQALAGADEYMVCVYDRFPTVPISPGWEGPPYGVYPIWDSPWTDATSVAYAGPALQVGHVYYWIPVAKDPAWTAFSYGELRSFTAQ